MWGNGVAKQAPTAGQPGSYVPAPAPSTSYGGGYYSGGGGGTGGGNSGDGVTRKPFVNKPLNLQTSTFTNTADVTMTAMESADALVSAHAARPGGIAGVQASGGGYMPRFAGVGRYVPYVGVGLTVAADFNEGGGFTKKTGAYLAVDGGAILAGMAAGAITGAAIGTIIPGAGNVVGGVLGAVIAVTPIIAAAGMTLFASYLGHRYVNGRRWD